MHPISCTLHSAPAPYTSNPKFLIMNLEPGDLGGRDCVCGDVVRGGRRRAARGGSTEERCATGVAAPDGGKPYVF